MSAKRWLFPLVLVVTCAGSAASFLRADEKTSGTYQSVIETRAVQAQKEKNVQTMVECAYALYPIEVLNKAKDPRHVSLMHQAAELVLAKKDAAEAKQFLSVAGPLAASLSAETQEKLTSLALGKSEDQAIKDAAERVRGPAVKLGPDVADPTVKTRGALDRDLAEAVGFAVLFCVRPVSTLGSEPSPKLVDYKFSYPRSNRVSLYIKMAWYGLWTGNRYESKIWIDIESYQGTLEVLSIDYSDPAFPAAKTSNLVALKRELNQLFRKK